MRLLRVAAGVALIGSTLTVTTPGVSAGLAQPSPTSTPSTPAATPEPGVLDWQPCTDRVRAVGEGRRQQPRRVRVLAVRASARPRPPEGQEGHPGRGAAEGHRHRGRACGDALPQPGRSGSVGRRPLDDRLTCSPSPSEPASTSSPTTPAASAPPPRRSRAGAATSPSPTRPDTGTVNWAEVLTARQKQVARPTPVLRREPGPGGARRHAGRRPRPGCSPRKRSATTRSPTGASRTARCSGSTYAQLFPDRVRAMVSTATWTRRRPWPVSPPDRWHRTTRSASSCRPPGCATKFDEVMAKLNRRTIPSARREDVHALGPARRAQRRRRLLPDHRRRELDPGVAGGERVLERPLRPRTEQDAARQALTRRACRARAPAPRAASGRPWCARTSPTGCRTPASRTCCSGSSARHRSTAAPRCRLPDDLQRLRRRRTPPGAAPRAVRPADPGHDRQRHPRRRDPVPVGGQHGAGLSDDAGDHHRRRHPRHVRARPVRLRQHRHRGFLVSATPPAIDLACPYSPPNPAP